MTATTTPAPTGLPHSVCEARASGPAPSLRRRLAAFVYEGVLLFGVLMVIGALYSIATNQRHALHGREGMMAVVFLSLALYFMWFWTHGGQTLAMKTWRIRLVNANGGGIQPLQALLRYLLAWPSLGFFGAGLVWALFDRDGQFLHDRLAGTRLVNSNHA